MTLARSSPIREVTRGKNRLSRAGKTPENAAKDRARPLERDDYYSTTLDDWRQIAESFVKLELVPSKVRTYVTK